MEAHKYKRVLIKISGEALAGDKHFGLNFDVIGPVCDVIKKCNEQGCEIGVVVGGGNFWRGVKDGGGKMERTRADHMGMLATTINALALADALEQRGVPVRATWKKAAWSFSAAARATHFSRPTPRRFCGRQKSARKSSCWPKMWTVCMIPTRRKTRTQKNMTTFPTWMCLIRAWA